MLPTAASSPLFSILLPTHNQARLLKPALESALLQTCGDFEILVVADGCTDSTVECVRAFSDPRIRLFDLPKALGFGYANRNVALRESRGALIAFLAHDDLYSPDHLETMKRAFEDPDAMWAYSRPVIVEADGSYHASPQNLHVPAMLDHFLKRRITVPASAVVYRQACHDLFGYWDPTIERAGDREIWGRYVRGAGPDRIRFVSRPTTLHFRAPWRTNFRGAKSKAREFRDPFPGDWPLKIDLGPSDVEQDVFLERMKADPVQWCYRFQRDVQASLDGKLFAFEWNRNRQRRESVRRWRERKGRTESPPSPDSSRDPLPPSFSAGPHRDGQTLHSKSKEEGSD